MSLLFWNRTAFHSAQLPHLDHIGVIISHCWHFWAIWSTRKSAALDSTYGQIGTPATLLMVLSTFDFLTSDKKSSVQSILILYTTELSPQKVMGNTANKTFADLVFQYSFVIFTNPHHHYTIPVPHSAPYIFCNIATNDDSLSELLCSMVSMST